MAETDLISRQAAIHLITGYNGVMDKSVAKRLLIQMPSAQPWPQWIPCSERLPEVSYDYLGNWSSPEVILLMNDEEYFRVCNGHYNPVGVFEVFEDDGPAFVGRPVEHVNAWMPLPEPYREEGKN